jgi:ubiquinone/menaquinone biosynthesis C-methylase UbiE
MAEQGPRAATMGHVDYNEVAAVYDRRYRPDNLSGIAEHLQQLSGEVSANRALEVGCGTGHWLTLMHNCALRCGLDYSAPMLDEARKKDGSLVLIQGTASHLPFRQKAFDLVYCVHALHHFDDPPAFIYEARNVIQEGGALAIIGMDPQTEQDRWYLYDYFPGTYETDLERYPSGDMILRWMEGMGFVRCERGVAARITHDFVGYEVFDDPILHRNGTSQLSLLTEDAFVEGMEHIMNAVQQAERRGEPIVFSTRITLPAVVGFIPEATCSCA